MSERADSIKGRMRRLNRLMLVPPLAVVGTVLVVVDAETWWEAVVLAMGIVATVLVVRRWAMEDPGDIVLPGLIVTAAVWPFGALVSGSHTAYYGIGLVGSVFVVNLQRHRGAAMLAMVTYVAGVGATRLLVATGDPADTLIRFVVLPAGISVVTIGGVFVTKLFFDLVQELEEARERETELAVARERVRFAGDLHDIQGHTLHVVKLKTALAQKLVRPDPEKAEDELREIHSLVADTISQTKELAYAQRRLNLSVELENAKNLFEAAGILVRVNREADVDPRASELLGQVLRETTTNILRHAQATRVRITVEQSGITIVNDGARGTTPPELRGLHTLKGRLADDGGELTVELEDGRFVTAARFPSPRPALPAH
ncbi:sensor histidine kinase [Prauserella cavernicola]|uniref:Sensor histidine kinase n=1 Tax=Prauserella cavernicola TaxID=2800127 RepID=A0A934R0E1_9PSEU|nr:histidine kinase [Prauserella cavernicola]MBK1789392.1 sensor histidine kinase [Prauserella cavernicola]